ncbi:hypothetical protein [Mesorhizobium sp. M1D.F.Ca.ET.183.01.1.1]|uniref:hypothetical protein n=1 Tax=Mesorhizobium sp. M1D.F.Ca.ET.183.01.1.1 TaxID=2496666 RepID=UPI001AEDC56D|nr:hypothetical protein [Mesorhizobium sp. M1D.F.Ca.ET.183.01.1.1]
MAWSDAGGKRWPDLPARQLIGKVRFDIVHAENELPDGRSQGSEKFEQRNAFDDDRVRAEVPHQRLEARQRWKRYPALASDPSPAKRRRAPLALIGQLNQADVRADRLRFAGRWHDRNKTNRAERGGRRGIAEIPQISAGPKSGAVHRLTETAGCSNYLFLCNSGRKTGCTGFLECSRFPSDAELQEQSAARVTRLGCAAAPFRPFRYATSLRRPSLLPETTFAVEPQAIGR